MASDFEFALMTLPVFVFWVFAFIALNRIVGVIKCCKHLNYFSQSNAQSIKFLAYVLIVYAIGVPFLEFIFKIVELGRLEFSFVIDIEYSFISTSGFRIDPIAASQNSRTRKRTRSRSRTYYLIF